MCKMGQMCTKEKGGKHVQERARARLIHCAAATQAYERTLSLKKGTGLLIRVEHHDLMTLKVPPLLNVVTLVSFNMHCEGNKPNSKQPLETLSPNLATLPVLKHPSVFLYLQTTYWILRV